MAKPECGSVNSRDLPKRITWTDWYVVVVAALLMSATLPGRTHGLGLITKRLLEDLAMDPVVFAQINLWATLMGAMFCLPCGWLIDRWGIRMVAFATVLPLSVVVYLLTGMLANLAVGVIATRVSLQPLLAVSLLLLGATLGGFPWITMLWQVYIYAALLGVAGGILTVLFFTVWKQAYGQRHLGAIQGAAQMLTVFASALGPLLVAISQRYSGSYTTIFTVAATISLIASVTACFTTVPRAAHGHWLAQSAACRI